MTLYTSAAASARLLSKRTPFTASRSFSSARPLLKEIQDAYILSGSRTPTAKVSYLRSVERTV